ncbi:MAG: AbgT family transporter [Phascolarctobacterium sp.]|nr:AbgT family transporter [Phascolarctobacterium sp.]
MSKQNDIEPSVKQFKPPSPVMVLAVIILLAALASYIIPAGVYDRVKDAHTGKMVVNPTTFHYIAQKPTSFLQLLTSVTKGFQGGGSIIAFLFVVGGSLNIYSKTGAIIAGLGALVKKMRNRGILMVPVIMVFFSICSTLAGCNEEYLAFTPLIVTVALALGFDSITALGIIFCSVAAGYGAGCTQPFSVGVAQGIAGVPLFSAIEYRIGLFIVLVLVNVCYVMYYARKVKNNPESSSMYELDKTKDLGIDVENVPELTGRQKIVLCLLAFNFIAIIVGVMKFDFYMHEIAGIFLLTGLIAGVLCNLKANDIADAFVEGCKGMMLPCLMVGLCKGATLLLDQAKVMDTIVHFLASMLQSFPSSIIAFGMFMIQDVFNLLVPSSSGQAAISMPIMAPLADVVGLTRQTAVFAFTLGDAFTNCITPASGATMSYLAIAGVPYKKWLRFILPLIAVWWIIAFCFLTYAAAIKLGPV